jgi:hypothetical protein
MRNPVPFETYRVELLKTLRLEAYGRLTALGIGRPAAFFTSWAGDQR